MGEAREEGSGRSRRKEKVVAEEGRRTWRRRGRHKEDEYRWGLRARLWRENLKPFESPKLFLVCMRQ
jgi:hypothetical protein